MKNSENLTILDFVFPTKVADATMRFSKQIKDFCKIEPNILTAEISKVRIPPRPSLIISATTRKVYYSSH